VLAQRLSHFAHELQREPVFLVQPLAFGRLIDFRDSGLGFGLAHRLAVYARGVEKQPQSGAGRDIAGSAPISGRQCRRLRWPTNTSPSPWTPATAEAATSASSCARTLRPATSSTSRNLRARASTTASSSTA